MFIACTHLVSLAQKKENLTKRVNVPKKEPPTLTSKSRPDMEPSTVQAQLLWSLCVLTWSSSWCLTSSPEAQESVCFQKLNAHHLSTNLHPSTLGFWEVWEMLLWL